MSLERTYTGLAEPVLSWSSIFGGALVALATSIFLGLLAAGFGLELSSGGVASHASLQAFTPETGAIAVAIQVISAAFGGYVAGRLRHVWTLAHADEAHFRDTAHGLIAWALATVAGVGFVMLVATPYAEALAPMTNAATAPSPPPSPAEIARAAHIAAQSAFFAAVGLILAAFVSAVAARLGGQQAEHMHARYAT